MSNNIQNVTIKKIYLENAKSMVEAYFTEITLTCTKTIDTTKKYNKFNNYHNKLIIRIHKYIIFSTFNHDHRGHIDSIEQFRQLSYYC